MLRALGSPASYIALIASKKRSKLVLDFLHQEGISGQALGRVAAPAGLDLGTETPEEIALSVMSEIVMERRNGSGAPMRDGLQDGGAALSDEAESRASMTSA